MKNSEETQEVFKDIKGYEKMTKDAIIRGVVMDVLEDLTLYFMQYNPQITKDGLRKVSKQVSIEKGGQDYMEELDFTREGAKLKGIEIGRQEGRQEIISRLLQANMDIQKICEITHLSKQEILQVQNQLKQK